jgi:hypothetical protein
VTRNSDVASFVRRADRVSISLQAGLSHVLLQCSANVHGPADCTLTLSARPGDRQWRSLRSISRFVSCGDLSAPAYDVSAVAVNLGYNSGSHMLIGVDLDS